MTGAKLGGEISEWLRAAASEEHPSATFNTRGLLLDAADIIDRLHAQEKLLRDGYEHVRDLVDQFAEHCRCEQTSATMFILHRAAMKHDPWSASKAVRGD